MNVPLTFTGAVPLIGAPAPIVAPALSWVGVTLKPPFTRSR